MKLTRRAHLPHEIPSWVDPWREIYFITICCLPRGRNQLATPAVAQGLFETIENRNQRHLWFAYLVLFMPDHVHGLFSFPPEGKSIQRVIWKWKEWTAIRLGIAWQRDFFEHRLRRDESWRRKADYILQNPVRAGLVTATEEWPYVWISSFPAPRGR